MKENYIKKKLYKNKKNMKNDKYQEKIFKKKIYIEEKLYRN